MTINSAVEHGKLVAKFAAIEGVQQSAIDQLNDPAEVAAFKASALDADAYLAKLKAERAHLFAPAVDPAVAEAAAAAAITKHEAAGLAFGPLPTMQARGLYLQAHGLEDYKKTMAAWGASALNLVPGHDPLKKADEREIIPKKGDAPVKRNDNPWSDAYSGKDAEARRLSILRNSTVRAASLAKSEGKMIDGRPLRKTING